MGRAAVRGAGKAEVGRAIIVHVVLNRNGEQTPRCLAAKERCAVIVANTGLVAKIVAPRFVESGTFFALFEAVQANNAHFGVSCRHLQICASGTSQDVVSKERGGQRMRSNQGNKGPAGSRVPRPLFLQCKVCCSSG